MEHVAFSIHLLFVLITILTVLIFYRAAGRSNTALAVIIGWLIIQAGIGISGVYTVTDTMPPRFLLLIGPPLLLILVLFITARGRLFIDGLNIKVLLILHVIRIPVELVLWALYIHKVIPQEMTFEGRNWDIVSGITAPVVFYFGFVNRKLSKRIILFWNFICLGLLINIVVTAILSAPTPFQQLAFDQPNIAVLYFPYIWLPCCIVPLVLFSHLAAIRHLLKS